MRNVISFEINSHLVLNFKYFDHHFRLTTSRIQRIIKFQFQIIDFISNHADLIDKYK
jgi:hypothetical protein